VVSEADGDDVLFADACAALQVEKVPDSTYDMIGGLDKQIREIKEVRGYQVYIHVRPPESFLASCRLAP
jgi:ATP-dependent 26S proteasome regulatory subunit